MDISPGNVNILAAFLAGVLSFFSPCILPLIPAYLSYITGITFKDLTQELVPPEVRLTTVTHALFFIAGFTAIFVILGLSFAFLGGFVSRNRYILQKIGGVVVIFFGLAISGVINLGFLQKERKFETKVKPSGYLGSLFVGAIFSLGWTPCLGPILSSILIVSSTAGQAHKGAILLLAYSLGLGLPLLLSALLINNFLAYFKKIKKFLRVISILSGLLLIALGAMMVFA